MMSVSDSEIREALLNVAATTQNESVRQVMERALRHLENYDENGFVRAATTLLNEMAAVQRAQRLILWLGPIVSLVFTAILFWALRTFFLSI